VAGVRPPQHAQRGTPTVGGQCHPGGRRRMHRKAAALWQSDLPLAPLAGFEEAAVAYTQARIWQDCAQTIEPELPDVQPKLDWTSPPGPQVTVRKGSNGHEQVDSPADQPERHHRVVGRPALVAALRGGCR
jgi:hypothetical protein